MWPRGVDATVFCPSKRSAELRDRWHVSDRSPALLYVGRVSREKGLDLLPGLTERLYRTQLRHRLIIVGDGPMRRVCNKCRDHEILGRCHREDRS